MADKSASPAPLGDAENTPIITHIKKKAIPLTKIISKKFFTNLMSAIHCPTSRTKRTYKKRFEIITSAYIKRKQGSTVEHGRNILPATDVRNVF